MELLAHSIEHPLLQAMKDSDEKYLAEISAKLQVRRNELFKRIEQENLRTIQKFREVYWIKVNEVRRYRNERIQEKQRELEATRQCLMRTHRETLRCEMIRQIGGTCCSTDVEAACLLESAIGVIDRQANYYENKLREQDEALLYRARKSALDEEEFLMILHKRIIRFHQDDELQLQSFRRSVGDEDERLEEIMKRSDSLFRARAAVEVKNRNPQIQALIFEHHKNRDTLLTERLGVTYEKELKSTREANQSLIQELQDTCPGCFGQGYSSEQYFELCPEVHEESS
jgi:hypothetical protein